MDWVCCGRGGGGLPPDPLPPSPGPPPPPPAQASPCLPPTPSHSVPQHQDQLSTSITFSPTFHVQNLLGRRLRYTLSTKQRTPKRRFGELFGPAAPRVCVAEGWLEHQQRLEVTRCDPEAELWLQCGLRQPTDEWLEGDPRAPLCVRRLRGDAAAVGTELLLKDASGRGLVINAEYQVCPRGVLLVRTRTQGGGVPPPPSQTPKWLYRTMGFLGDGGAGDFVLGIRQAEIFLFDPMCLHSKYSEFCGEFKNG